MNARSGLRVVFAISFATLLASQASAQDSTWANAVRSAKDCQSQGRYKEAIAHSQACMRIAEEEVPPNLVRLADSYVLHASVCHDLARYRESEDSYNKCLRCLDEFKPNPWQKRFFVLNNLGTLFLDQGDYKRADLHLQAAMEIMKTQELTPASVGACVNNIGLMKKLQGNFVEAYSLYKTAHKALEADQSPDKSLIMLSFNNLANLCIEVNKLNEAAEYLDAFDRLVDETVGRNHAVFSRALHSRSKLLTKQLKYNQAEQTCHDAVALSERTFGASHPYTASCYNTLGSIQLKRLQLRQAETSIKRAIAIFDESYAVKNHPRTAEALTNLGDVYFVGEQVQQARDAYRNALQMLHALCTDPQHPQRLLVQRKLNLSLNEGN